MHNQHATIVNPTCSLETKVKARVHDKSMWADGLSDHAWNVRWKRRGMCVLAPRTTAEAIHPWEFDDARWDSYFSYPPPAAIVVVKCLVSSHSAVTQREFPHNNRAIITSSGTHNTTPWRLRRRTRHSISCVPDASHF